MEDVKYKRCTKCKKIKLITLFNKGKGYKDNYSTWCKDCFKKYRKNWSKHNKDKMRKIRQRALKVYRNKNPEKYKCRWTVWNHLKLGNIKRPNFCTNCGVGCIPEAHHNDYSKPFNIQWLCRACHVGLHNKKGDFITNEAK